MSTIDNQINSRERTAQGDVYLRQRLTFIVLSSPFMFKAG